MENNEESKLDSLFIKIYVTCSWNQLNQELSFDILNNSFDHLKLKLLKTMKSRSKNPENFEIYLTYLNLQMPLLQEADFFFMISDIIQNNDELILINIRKINRKYQKLIVYDEKGSVADKEENKLLNRPSDKLYDEKAEVICAFCRESSTQPFYIRELGPFYGPYKSKNKLYYFHEQCAIWTPKICLNESNKMKNILTEIKRCNKIYCSYCRALGGGLGCKNEICKNTYHYKCVLNEDLDCRLDFKNYVLYCSQHMDEYIDDEFENTICNTCNGGNDDDKMIICDKCPNAYHTYCLEIKLEKIPEGDWICPVCISIKK